MLGKLAGETPPDLIVCVGDASNLRLALRLALELKHVGRPVVLALNMMDIATQARHRDRHRRGWRRARHAGGESVAVRRGGTDALLAELDELLRATLPPAAAADWRAPDAGALRGAQREADRVLRAAVKMPGRPDPRHRAQPTRSCCIRSAGLVDPARHPVRDVPGGVRLGASPLMDLIPPASPGSARSSAVLPLPGPAAQLPARTA